MGYFFWKIFLCGRKNSQFEQKNSNWLAGNNQQGNIIKLLLWELLFRLAAGDYFCFVKKFRAFPAHCPRRAPWTVEQIVKHHWIGGVSFICVPGVHPVIAENTKSLWAKLFMVFCPQYQGGQYRFRYASMWQSASRGGHSLQDELLQIRNRKLSGR